MKSLETQFRDTLSNYYDKYTTEEWIEQHIIPLSGMIGELTSRANILTEDSVWPRRPLPKVPLGQKDDAAEKSK